MQRCYIAQLILSHSTVLNVGRLQYKLSYFLSSVEVTKEKMSSSIKVKLPLDNGSCCNLCAVLERNPTNTITLHIWPDVMVVNRCPISVQVLTKLQESEDEEMKEVVSLLSPNDVGIVSLDKVWHIIYTSIFFFFFTLPTQSASLLYTFIFH